MNDWQPIETAPKDGTLFLCWVKAEDRGEQDDGSFVSVDVSQHDFCQYQDFGENGYFANMSGKFSDLADITHWMPLPTPPGES